jgi:hypothetical protein
MTCLSIRDWQGRIIGQNIWVRHPDAQSFRATRCRSHNTTLPLHHFPTALSAQHFLCSKGNSFLLYSLLKTPSLKPPVNHWHCTGDSLVVTRESLGDHKGITREFKEQEKPAPIRSRLYPWLLFIRDRSECRLVRP